MKYLALVFSLVFSTTLLGVAQTESKKPTSSEVSTKLSISIPDLRKMQSKLQEHKFLSLKFEQTIYKKLRKKTIKNQGEVYFEKPSSFHWTFNHSEPEEWIYNGQTLLHYYPKKSYAYRYKANAAKGKNLREIVSMVLDFDSLLRRYTVKSSSRNQDIVNLELTPNEPGEITQVQLVLDITNNFIKEVKLNFEGGNYSVFAFSNPRHAEIKNNFSLSSTVKITDPI